MTTRLLAAVVVASLSGCAAPDAAVPGADRAVVMIDEAHDNYHTLDGRYAPFAEAVRSRGYSVQAIDVPFTAFGLQDTDVLVIANARPTEGDDPSAFTIKECAAVARWVRSGGALLLIADHAPFGGAAVRLAREFGVNMRDTFTMDPEHHVEDALGGERWLVFSRENGLLRDHVITRGAGRQERVNRVETFAGQSIRGPAKGTVLLALSDTAVDLPDRYDHVGATDVEPMAAAGRAQGVAFEDGRGRVVVLGEAAMMTSQRVSVRGSEPVDIGFERESNDNRQFVLNVIAWLAGDLEEPDP